MELHALDRQLAMAQAHDHVARASRHLELIREVRSQGLAVMMISHNLPEVFAVADRITVLRNGRTITTLTTKDTSLEAIVGMMTGAVGVAAA